MEQGAFIFHAGENLRNPSKNGTQCKRRNTQVTEETVAKRKKGADGKPQPGKESSRETNTNPVSLGEIPSAVEELGPFWEKILKIAEAGFRKTKETVTSCEAVVSDELDIKSGSVTELKKLREENNKLTSPSEAQRMLVRDMEDSIKTYQKKLDEMTADRIKLRNDSHEREKEAEHVRLSIRRELDGVKAALGEAQFQSGKLSSQNQDLTKDILDLQALLANANAKTVEAERKAEKSNNKALQSEKMLIGLQSDLACLVDRFVHRS